MRSGCAGFLMQSHTERPNTTLQRGADGFFTLPTSLFEVFRVPVPTQSETITKKPIKINNFTCLSPSPSSVTQPLQAPLTATQGLLQVLPGDIFGNTVSTVSIFSAGRDGGASVGLLFLLQRHMGCVHVSALGYWAPYISSSQALRILRDLRTPCEAAKLKTMQRKFAPVHQQQKADL